MTLRLVTPPTTEVVSLAELKKHVRAEYHTDDDDYLKSLALVAVAWAEKWLGLAIAPQAWEYTLAGLSGCVALPLVPVTDVGSVTYEDADGVEQTLTGFRVFNENTTDKAYLLPALNADWPATSGQPECVSVTFTAGFETIPPQIKHAVLLLVGAWYENREAVADKPPTQIPFGVEALLLPLRNW